MKNIVRELDLDNFEDDDSLGVERIERRASFKDESYRREKRGDSIRRKRKQKERERQFLTKDSEYDSE